MRGEFPHEMLFSQRRISNALAWRDAEVSDPPVPASIPVTEMLPALRAFARALCRNHMDADDLIQETLVRALASIEQFEVGTNMKAWLFTIMRNNFNTAIRKYRREAPGSVDCVSVTDTRSHAAPQEWSQTLHEVEVAMQRLPQWQREILVLVSVNGFSYEEAARICGCEVGTVKSRLYRARAKLLAELRYRDVSEVLARATEH